MRKLISLRNKEVPCAVLVYQVPGESWTLKKLRATPLFESITLTSLSSTDVRSKMTWHSSKEKKQLRSLSSTRSKREISEICSPKQDTHFISASHVHHSHFLRWKGVPEIRKKETAANAIRKRWELQKELIDSDSMPNLREDHDPEEGDTQAFP